MAVCSASLSERRFLNRVCDVCCCRKLQTKRDEKTEEQTSDVKTSVRRDQTSPVYYNVVPDGRVDQRPPGDDFLYEDLCPVSGDVVDDNDGLYEQVPDSWHATAARPSTPSAGASQPGSQQTTLVVDSSLDLTVIDNDLYDHTPEIQRRTC